MNTTPFLHTIPSPIGALTIGGSTDAVCFVAFDMPPHEEMAIVPEALKLAAEQLIAYFSGELRVFSVPLLPEGTPFQQTVWKQLIQIPYGRISNYRTIAQQLGDTNKVRAVGGANGRNPVAIIVPCHRVIGSDASLTGYAGGLWRKQWLLEHEQKLAGGVQLLF